MDVFLTGASGFIGGALLKVLIKKDYIIHAAVRNFFEADNHQLTQFLIDDINRENNWKDALVNKKTVIHCAARVHIIDDKADSPLEAFREINTFGTINLAQQAADAGVKRFIFISSITVNGNQTEKGSPFEADAKFDAVDLAGISKSEAEIGLHKISDETGMEVVIIRSPLVYGPGVKANFETMMKWVKKGLPLPLGGIVDNRRSLVFVDNLVDLIVTCIEHPKAANKTFLVSDGEDVSTSQLLSNMSMALGVPNKLLPIPSHWLILAAKLIGKSNISQRLCSSLQVDISKTKNLLSWSPPYSMAEGMKKTADVFLNNLDAKNKK